MVFEQLRLLGWAFSGLQRGSRIETADFRSPESLIAACLPAVASYVATAFVGSGAKLYWLCQPGASWGAAGCQCLGRVGLIDD